MRSMTWKPKPGMTEKQIEKELNRQAVLFDEKCSAQGVGNGNIKFQAFAEQWFKEYAVPNLRPRTVARLHQLEARTYTAIGHIRLDRLTARHIQRFIDNLGEDGISAKRDLAKPKIDFYTVLKDMTQKNLAETSGVSRSTISSMCRGEGVTLSTAEKSPRPWEKLQRTYLPFKREMGNWLQSLSSTIFPLCRPFWITPFGLK